MVMSSSPLSWRHAPRAEGGNATKNKFRDMVSAAARLAVSDNRCRDVVTAVYDVLVAASKDQSLDMRAALYVVDRVLRTAQTYIKETMSSPGSDGSARAAKTSCAVMVAEAMTPHLGRWLHQLILHRRTPDSLKRTRTLMQDWFNNRWLPE